MMNNFLSDRKSKIRLASFGILLSFLGIPTGVWAANGNSPIAISDFTLLCILLGVILVLLFVIKAISQSIIGINKRYKHENNNEKIVKAIAVLVFIGSSFSASAANEESIFATFKMSSFSFWLLITIIVCLALIIAILFKTLKNVIKLQSGESFEEKESTILDSLNSVLTDNVPIENESNVMLDHNYDGIRELDNNLPPWWKYMFYATIIFAFVYLIRFHITGSGKLSGEEYQQEMQLAELEKASSIADAGEVVNEENVSYLIDEASLTKGAAIYSGNCVTCHGTYGEGGAGPNLTDQNWIHGGGIQNVFKSIKYGVPAKGMIAWQSQFNPAQIQSVASYVLSLQGSNPANAKAPQGEIWIEVAEPTLVSDSVSTDSLVNQ